MSDITSIQIHQSTLTRLKESKLISRETYDDVINRALDVLEKVK